MIGGAGPDDSHRDAGRPGLPARSQSPAEPNPIVMPTQVDPGGPLDTSLRGQVASPLGALVTERSTASSGNRPSSTPPPAPSAESSPSLMSRAADAATSPAVLGGGGTAVISANQAIPFPVAYAVLTLWTLANEMRLHKGQNGEAPLAGAANTGFFSRLANSPALVSSMAAVVTGLQSVYNITEGQGTLGLAYGLVALGNVGLTHAVNSGAEYELFPDKKRGLGKLLSSLAELIPGPVLRFFGNPVPGFASANVTFAAMAPGTFADPVQLGAFSIGAAAALGGIITSASGGENSFRRSTLFGATSLAALATNAAIGGASFIATALGIFTAQHVSLYLRSKPSS